MLCSEILRRVNASTVIQFNQSKKRGFVQHTAIAISFDGIPLFTLDYYPKNDSLPSMLTGSASSSAGICVALATGSDIRINNYHSSDSSIERLLLKFMINTAMGRKRAIDLLKELSKIDMGKYSTFSNNCRDFVEKAIRVLLDNKEEYSPRSFTASTASDRRNHYGDIRRIRQNDKEKAILAGVGVAAIFGAAYGIYKALNEDSDSD